MQGFIDYFRQYWYLFVIFVVAFIAMLFMFKKAGAALAKTKAEKEKLMKKLDHMKMIRETYSDLTEEKILSDKTEYLLEGVADNIQLRLEKNENMNDEFEKLNEEEKLMYALHYFLDEAATDASAFFRQYTKPLTPYALSACEIIADKETLDSIKKLYDAYDEDNETESVIEEKIKEFDGRIRQTLDITQAKMKAAEFIKQNAGKFV